MNAKPTKRFAVCATVAWLLSAYSPLFAETEATQWSSVAWTTSGTCADGAVATVSERAGKMHLKLALPNGKQYAEFDVALAENGSGKAQFEGSIGPTNMEVPAGSGSRPLKTAQVQGVCQWLWVPR